MSPSILHFCPKCLATRQAVAREVCEECGRELLPFFDESGAISRDYLLARGCCCDNGCRNCPYEKAEPAKSQCVTCGQEKTCQRCGSGFECRSGNCWCDDVPLSPATLKKLQETYVGCLCPSCLAEFSEV